MTTYNEGVVRVMEVGDGVDDALRVSDGEGVTDVLEAVQRRRRDPVREVGQNAAQKLSDCLVGELVLVEDGVVLAQFVVAASRSLGYNSWSWNVCLDSCPLILPLSSSTVVSIMVFLPQLVPKIGSSSSSPRPLPAVA